MLEAIQELQATARVVEMAGDGETINVPVDPRIDVGVLTADDPSPMFVNLEVIRTGTSVGNRRFYNAQVVRQISEMIPGVQGYLGHPDPSKVGFEFREPHCIFVGSMVQEMQEGGVPVTRTLAKAYIFKSSPLREWIPKSIAAGNPMTVSINGTGDVARDTVNNILHVQSMSTLDSIDWANPGTQGMPTAQVLSVVSEMNKGGKTMADLGEVLKGITIAELNTHNPVLVNQIQEGAKITEIALKVDGKDQSVKITELQSMLDGKDAKILELSGTIDTLNAQIKTAKITEYKNTKVVELVPEQYRESVSKRVSGSTEAEIDASINSELAFVREIAGDRFNNLPKGKGARKDIGDMEEKVKNLFGSNKTK